MQPRIHTIPVLRAAFLVLTVVGSQQLLSAQAKGRSQPLVLAGQADRITALSFSPDGRWLVSGSANAVVKLWEIPSGRESRSLKSHTKSISSLVFSPDSRSLVSASDDSSIRIWDPVQGVETKALLGNEYVYSVAVSHNGKLLASAGADGKVKLWEFTTGHEFASLTGFKTIVYTIAFTSDDSKFAIAEIGATGLALVDLTTGNLHKVWHRSVGPFSCPLLSSDARLLAFVSDSLADQETPKSVEDILKGDLPKQGPLSTAIAEVATGKELRRLPGDKKPVLCLQFSADGQWLALGKEAGTIEIWNLNTGSKWRTLKGAGGSVSALAFSPDGSWLASGNEDGSIALWNLAELRLTNSVPRAQPLTLRPRPA